MTDHALKRLVIIFLHFSIITDQSVGSTKPGNPILIRINGPDGPISNWKQWRLGSFISSIGLQCCQVQFFSKADPYISVSVFYQEIFIPATCFRKSSKSGVYIKFLINIVEPVDC